MRIIPSDMNSQKSPFDNVITNLMFVIRECAANATTYRFKKAHFFRFINEKKTYFCFMHDGQPFKNLEEIMEKGLTPNESGEQGWSFQGCGLAYCMSYMNKTNSQLTICSHTIESGFESATATPDWRTNRWMIEETPEWEKKLHKICGDKYFEEYYVFYIFRIPHETNDDNETN